MCGINGIISKNNSLQLENVVKEMNNQLSRRGPDAEGKYIHENFALGHRRLSIIDLSEHATQPMFDNSEDLALVFNGEIYNFKSLKAKLPDYTFKTNSDSEVILAAYQKWGKKCVDYFEGMFAFAILDKQKKKAFIARDRLGIKPLYYYLDENIFLFSSEIKALLASEFVPRKLNITAVHDYVRYQSVHAPDTIVENVKMLSSGQTLEIDTNLKPKIEQFWQLPDNFSSETKSIEQIKKEVHDLVYQAVEKRMISDVPLGAFLSGGIDSSIITGVMSQISSQKINTFSVNFDEAEFSEGKYAKMVAEKFNTNHTEILLSPKDFLDNLPDALQYMDHPSGDGPNSYIVSKATKNAGITVALSGLGGDEVFAGYDIFKQTHSLLNNKKITKLPKLVRKAGAKTLSSLKKDVRSQKIAEILGADNINFENIYSVSRLLYTDKQVKKFLSNKKLSDNRVTEIAKKYKIHSDYLLTAVSRAEIQTYMQNVLLRDTDQMSMANSLEVRVPFLDYKLVEYVLQLPDSIKYPHTAKQLLTESVDILPHEVIHRPKMGFVLPWENWLKNELFDFADKNIKILAEKEIFDGNEILSRWDAFQKGNKSVSWARLWIFIVLGHYIEKYNLTI